MKFILITVVFSSLYFSSTSRSDDRMNGETSVGSGCCMQNFHATKHHDNGVNYKPLCVYSIFCLYRYYWRKQKGDFTFSNFMATKIFAIFQYPMVTHLKFDIRAFSKSMKNKSMNLFEIWPIFHVSIKLFWCKTSQHSSHECIYLTWRIWYWDVEQLM